MFPNDPFISCATEMSWVSYRGANWWLQMVYLLGLCRYRLYSSDTNQRKRSTARYTLLFRSPVFLCSYLSVAKVPVPVRGRSSNEGVSAGVWNKRRPARPWPSNERSPGSLDEKEAFPTRTRVLFDRYFFPSQVVGFVLFAKWMSMFFSHS